MLSSAYRPDPIRVQAAAPAAAAVPAQLAQDLARAGALLNRGDRAGARRVVRRVFDNAAPALLAELADRPPRWASVRRPGPAAYAATSSGDRVCAECRADGLGRDPLELRRPQPPEPPEPRGPVTTW